MNNNIRAKKSLGQNFLKDPHYLKKIVDAANIGPADQVLEIGPAGVTSIAGPNVITADGVRAIAPVRPAPRAVGAPASTQPLLDRAGEASDLSPRLLEAIAYVESRFRQKGVEPAIKRMRLRLDDSIRSNEQLTLPFLPLPHRHREPASMQSNSHHLLRAVPDDGLRKKSTGC